MKALTTRQVPAAIKRGELHDPTPGGKVLCSLCRAELGDTESPRFWSKGDTVFCDKPGSYHGWTLALPVFGDIELDLSR